MSRPATSRRSLDNLADLQDGVLTRAQLLECGYDRFAIQAQLDARRWQRAARNVVVLHNGPLTTRQRRWVGVLSQTTAALAGVTAAHEHGLKGFDDDLVHVLVPYGARIRAADDVVVHVSRRFNADDVCRSRLLPTVRVERALVDAASWMRLPRKACAVLAAGVQQRLTTASRLKPELASAQRARHHALLTYVLADIEGGAESFGEIDLGRLARRAGLPTPKRQAFRYDRAGRRRWLDADMDGFFVEVDGAVHLRALNYWNDMDRQNDLLIVTGRPILRFSTVAIRLAPARVMEQLAAAAARFGNKPVC